MLNIGTWMIGLIIGIGTFASAGIFSDTDVENFYDDDESYYTTEKEDFIDVSGEELYQQSCAACHANDLGGGAGPDLIQVGEDYSLEEIEDIIIYGKGEMPAGVVESPGETNAIATWLVEVTK